jgi:hypothetical protein
MGPAGRQDQARHVPHDGPRTTSPARQAERHKPNAIMPSAMTTSVMMAANGQPRDLLARLAQSVLAELDRQP